MDFIRKLFRKDVNSRKSNNKLPHGYVPDGGIHYYRARNEKLGDHFSDKITIISYGKAGVHVGESTFGTMLIFNEIKENGEYCVSVIVPESADELRAKLAKCDGVFTVKGRLSNKDYLDGNGIPYCPIIGEVIVE